MCSRLSRALAVKGVELVEVATQKMPFMYLLYFKTAVPEMRDEHSHATSAQILPAR